MNTYAYIYKISNNFDENLYVGFTSRSIEERWKQHVYLSNKSESFLHRAIKKYGIDNFKIEVIAKSSNIEYCRDVLEPYYIKQYNSYAPNGYNMTLGGEGTLGYSFLHSDQTREKIRNSHLGKIHTEETKEKMRKAKLGKKRIFSEEHKEKIRQSLIRFNYTIF